MVLSLAPVTGATWTCVGAGGGSCTGSGSGNISDTVNVPKGGTVTYTLVATTSPAATTPLANTATVAVPGGTTDPVAGNNSATDTDTAAPSADLGITKTDGSSTYTPGNTVTYTIAVSNTGHSNAAGATVADTVLSLTPVTGASSTCVRAGGGTSGPASGT